MASEPIELKKIDDWRWEIPRTGRMNVPGRIYASEELLKHIREDKAPEQCANVAHLPGIVRYSIAMPDIHWGYGFPIGGVAAFDPGEGGVISPGGVGYDINCLSGDTPVLFAEGYTRPIQDVVVGQERGKEVVLLDTETNRVVRAPFEEGFGRRPHRAAFQIVTRSGRRIVATEDHPFLTPEGMRELGTIVAGDRVAVVAFEGVPYDEPTSELLVDESALRLVASRFGKTDQGNALAQGIAHVRPLLPLTRNHPALPVILKVAGYVTGDGHICFTGARQRGQVAFYGKAEDLETIARELQVWLPTSRVHSRHRKHAIETTYGLREFESTENVLFVRSTGFALLLAALGVPVGSKADQDWGLPPCVAEAPRWQQRLYLASYFGAELSSPKAFEQAGQNFQCPVLTVVKRAGWVESGEQFLEELGGLVEGFGVRVLKVSSRPEQENPDGSRSVRLRLVLADDTRSLTALWGRVGYEFNSKRQSLGLQAVGYLRAKEAAIDVRRGERERIQALRAAHGWGAKRIFAAMGTATTANLRFVERSIYEPEVEPRSRPGFPTFEAWREEATRGLGPSGAVWDEIASVDPVEPPDRVWDISVGHPDHNFIAGGFVVHNCGVRLIRTRLVREDVEKKVREVVNRFFQKVPAGVGSSGAISRLSPKEMRKLAVEGASFVIDRGLGDAADLEHIEAHGRIDGADPDAVSDRAYKRGADQVGTLGSGNHFLELQYVDEVYDIGLAEDLGLREQTVTISIHTGSRGFGYQVCDDYLAAMRSSAKKHGIHLPDPQLACAPLDTPEAKRYLGAMASAANFAFANRQTITSLAKDALLEALGVTPSRLGFAVVYDVCHNIAKFEKHLVDGVEKTLCIHRKGATRAFGPGHPETPAAYRETGQPVLIPGDMGRHSFVLVGTQKAMEETFGSSCHGAGRMMSRKKSAERARGRNLYKEMEAAGVIVASESSRTLAEEMPYAYKDASQVVDVMHNAGLSRKVCRLKPIGVVKG
ncbi:MAG: RtcB family protein [Planctomycetes bacterium]|nr:RtcB family protein [Planctomycetota bacterium]